MATTAVRQRYPTAFYSLIIASLLLPHRSVVGFRVAHQSGARNAPYRMPTDALFAAKELPNDSVDDPTHSSHPPPQKKTPPQPRKSHCTTVCAVPPPSATEAWEALTRARRELRDPGFYRWPPHANLLYPFLELNSMKKRNGNVSGEERDEVEEPLFREDMLDALSGAAAQCEPFEVTISNLGMFGGKSRGVLWAYPHSHCIGADVLAEKESSEDQGKHCHSSEPMIQLQALLEKAFPTCTEQRKQRQFHPHITLSHYANLEDASKAKEQIEEWWQPITYVTSDIYVLRRVGDGGQFEIAATVPLGSQAGSIVVHDPPIGFARQPNIEEDWVYEERMALKARRNNNGNFRYRKRAGGKRKSGRNKEPRIRDTPEVIEAKRSARKAKREALEREALAREALAWEAAERTDNS